MPCNEHLDGRGDQAKPSGLGPSQIDQNSPPATGKIDDSSACTKAVAAQTIAVSSIATNAPLRATCSISGTITNTEDAG